MQKKKGQYITGINAINEAIELGKPILKIITQKGSMSDRVKELIKKARSLEIPVQILPPERFMGSKIDAHQNIIAYLSAVEFVDIDLLIAQIYERAEAPLFIWLDGITDVRNIGAIARSALNFGAHAILVESKGTGALNNDAVHASAGALLNIPVYRFETVHKMSKILENNGIKLMACTEKSNNKITDIDYSVPICVVMGSEGEGISPEVMGKASGSFAIPSNEKIGSLNVSVAAGIMLYEAFKMRNN
jgi:23S rRNA (guanosine2251-2'-O)-methyltransferase